MKIKRLLSRSFMALGAVALAGVISCLTPLPWKLLKWLHGPVGAADFQPTVIVVLGGGGVPSPSTLARCYAGAKMAAKHPGTRVVLSILSADAAAESPIQLMHRELVLRGVDPARLLHETRGRDTREQAARTAELLGGKPGDHAVLVVTSDYHMRRSLACFRDAGFAAVQGRFPRDGESGADPGGHTTLRYTFWAAAETLVVSFRELAALAWYQATGRI